jgi:hypothetical protein
MPITSSWRTPMATNFESLRRPIGRGRQGTDQTRTRAHCRCDWQSGMPSSGRHMLPCDTLDETRADSARWAVQQLRQRKRHTHVAGIVKLLGMIVSPRQQQALS